MEARPVVLVIEHESACPPAHFGTWLTDAGAGLRICRPWAGDEIPDLAGVHGLLVLGGSMGANDDATCHWLGAVKDRIREAVAAGVPTLGICLGHQLLAVALGGRSEPNPPGQQVGLFDVGWMPGAVDDELMGPVATPRRGVQWNTDVVTELPEGATALAATAAGENQVARFGEAAWGVQLHPEVDREVLVSWAAGDRDDHLEKGIDQEAVLDEIDGARAELAEAWRPLAARFAELAGRRLG